MPSSSRLDWIEWNVETTPRWRASSENWDWVIYGVYADVETALKRVTPVEHRAREGYYYYAYGRSWTLESEEDLFTPAGVNLVYVVRGVDFLDVQGMIEEIDAHNPPKNWNGDVKRVLGR